MQVKCHTDRIRLFFLLHTIQDVQKAVDRMGEKPLTCCKGLDTKISSIYDGVAV